MNSENFEILDAVDSLSKNYLYHLGKLRGLTEAKLEGFAGLRNMQICLRAVSKGHDVGGLAAYAQYDYVVIDALWVETRYQRKGIGRAFIEKILERARDLKCHHVLTSNLEIQESLVFWEKHGFKVIGQAGGSPHTGKIFYLQFELISSDPMEPGQSDLKNPNGRAKL